MTPPRTSSREQHEFFSALGLEIELHAEASSVFSEVVGSLIGWYADETRAAGAKVFALTGRKPPPREVLSGWVGRALPVDAEGDALIGYAADALLIAGDHGASSSSPQLMAFESGDAGLYLLRPQNQRKLMGAEGWVPMMLHSPDTEAALSGIYRYEGCTQAFAEHARACEDCLAALEAWDFEHRLPAGFEAFRSSQPAPRRKVMEEGEPEEGVAIFIPRPPPHPPRQAPWWKFWG